MKKKTWSKPECSKIKLVPQEAQAGGCKTHIIGGPDTPLCHGSGGGVGSCRGEMS